MHGIAFNKASILKQIFFPTMFVYLTVQSYFPDIERVIPWGEALCLCLFFTIFKVEYTLGAQKRMIQCLYLWIFLIPLYGCWVTFVFWRNEYDPYYFWRSLVPFYYAVFFFFAYRWGPEFLGCLKRFRTIVLISVLTLLCYKNVGIGSSVVLGLVWLGIQYKNGSKRFFWYTYCLLGMIFFLWGQGGSIKVAILMLILCPVMVLIGRWWATFQPPMIQKILARAFFLGIFLLIAIGSHLLLEDVHKFMGAGQTQEDYSIEGVKGQSDFTDPNARWRLFIWSYVLGQFWQSPQGIGFGTPLLGEDLGRFFGWGIGDFEEMQFALGAHNSFLTILGRLGVVALIFFFLIGRYLMQIMKDLSQQMRQPFSYRDSEFRLVFGSLVVFLIAFTMASFSMVIETPLYAAYFWFPLGLFVRLSGDYIAGQRDVTVVMGSEKNRAVS